MPVYLLGSPLSPPVRLSELLRCDAGPYNVHAEIIVRINTVIDAILDWVSYKRRTKQIRVELRDEIIDMLNSIITTALRDDHAPHLDVLFDALNENLEMMTRGGYSKWYHG